jgi:hypothetical protein
MPTPIFQDLPYRATEFQSNFTTLKSQRVPFKLYSYQILAWIILTDPVLKSALSPYFPFPAILDLALNKPFMLNEEHLTDWAGMLPSYVNPSGGTVKVSGAGPIPTFRTNYKIWLVPNLPGMLQHDASASCYGLGCTAVFFPKNPPPGNTPAGALPKYPRMPLLGLKGLETKKLRLSIDTDRRLVNLTAP